MKTPDQIARERIRNSLDETLIVEAAAGTGKTSELVRRIAGVLRTGRTTVDRVVAVTFMRKAAGELRLRLRLELDAARLKASSASEIQNLENALKRLEEARIGTIHSFCAEILRQRPVEARIAPGFEELDQNQAASMYERAFDTWIQNALEDLLFSLLRDLRDVKKGYIKKFSSKYSRDQVVDAKDQLRERLREFERKSGADLSSLLQAEMRSLVQTYEELKARSGKLDFTDLLIRTRDLIRDNARVRGFLQEQFTHIFVDEFQDTDPIQAE